MAAVSDAGIDRPIALTRSLSGQVVYELDSDGKLLAINGFSRQLLATLPFGNRPVDLTAAQLDQEYIFVCSVFSAHSAQQQSAATYGLITQYTAKGRMVRTWTTPFPCSGVDSDLTGGMLYIGNAQGSEIMTLRASDPKAEIRLAFWIKGATSLGPLVFDQPRKAVYAADVSGTLFAYEIATGVTRVLWSHFAEPQALAISESGSSVYVADGMKHAVWKVSLTSQKPSAEMLATENLRNPTGLALGQPGHLWVSDAESNAIVDVVTNTPAKAGSARAGTAPK